MGEEDREGRSRGRHRRERVRGGQGRREPEGDMGGREAVGEEQRSDGIDSVIILHGDSTSGSGEILWYLGLQQRQLQISYV